MTVVARDEGYVGEIHFGQQQFPLRAHVDAGKLIGTFVSGGSDFSFSATLDGNAMTLITGDKTHTLKKRAINPLLQTQELAEAPAGYSVIRTTPVGKMLTVEKPDAKTVQTAVEATFPDLAHFFGERPRSGEHTKIRPGMPGAHHLPPKSRGSRSRDLSHAPLAKGASVAVIYCKADASKAEWDALTASTPVNAQAEEKILLKEYQFPDGTGSVGLAEGWTTHAQSCMNGVEIKGPADQTVYLRTASRQ